ncbi:MAG: hypothetical protein ALECFALPRED_001148 [Alectoria fallacina]|uniref:Uncharacterized protein n=1 Tax=Alectoria fallacina TaxID=1903189 RepID=A0A8H3F7Y5_9LECA|nr:MAG: hypothetical protein ALECFALPRED_001148 [Alectoria fallacina]
MSEINDPARIASAKDAIFQALLIPAHPSAETEQVKAVNWFALRAEAILAYVPVTFHGSWVRLSIPPLHDLPRKFWAYYKSSVGLIGLVHLRLGVGKLIGLAIFGVFLDKVLLAKDANGEAKPEFRLIPMIRTSFTVLIALFLYG